MLTNAEVIVGLWFVPVVLCIVVPLLMLCGWTVLQFSRKMKGEIKQLQISAEKMKDTSYKALQAETAA